MNRTKHFRLQAQDFDKLGNLSPNEQYNYLRKFCRYGKIQDVKKLIHLYPDISKKAVLLDEIGFSPIHHASFFAHLPIMEFLINESNVNVTSSDGLTPLHMVARYPFPSETDKTSDMEFHEIFDGSKLSDGQCIDPDLKNFIEINIRNLLTENAKENELSYNYRYSRVNMNFSSNKAITFLLNLEADINLSDNKGLSALHHAVEKNNLSALAELIKNKNCNINAQDQTGATPLIKAISMDNIFATVFLLLENSDITKCDFDSNSVIHIAIKNGNPDLLRIIMNTLKQKSLTKILIDKKNKFGFSPILLAVVLGNKSCLNEIIKHRPNCLDQTNYGDNCLHLALKSGNFEMIRFLVEKVKIPIDIHDNNGNYPIHLAIDQEDTKILNYLIKFGADVEERTFHQLTPYLISIIKKKIDHFKVLVDNGAKTSVTDGKCRTAIHLAVNHRARDILPLILERENSCYLINSPDLENNTPLLLACQCNDYESVEILLNKGANRKMKNALGQTVLHIVAGKGNLKLLKMLIKDMRFLDEIDNYGDTPLHYAVKENNLSCVKTLVENGANIHKTNFENYRPICIAISKNYESIVKFFLDNGIDISGQIGDSLPPLHVACRQGKENLVTLLLKRGANPTYRVESKFISVHNYSNALDVAVDHGNENCARKIILCRQWFPQVLRNRTIDTNDKIWSPMRKLIKFMPELANEVFDWCIDTNKKQPDDKDFELTYNFELIDDSYELWNEEVETRLQQKSSFTENIGQAIKSKLGFNKISEVVRNRKDSKLKNKKKSSEKAITYHTRKYVFANHPLKLMLDMQQEKLLRHPLVKTLIKLKWSRTGLFTYYANLFVFLLLGVCFVTYMIQSDPPYILNPNGDRNQCYLKAEDKLAFYNQLIILKPLILALAGVCLLKNIIQVFVQKLGYFQQIESYIEVFLYISSILVVLDFNECNRANGSRLDWQWQLGVTATLTFWITGCFNLCKIPFFGIYFVLFTTVTKTFLEFALIFSVFVCGYSIIFYLLFANQTYFLNTKIAIMKTFSMAIGELDYNAVFFSDSKLIYPTLSFLVWYTFILLINLVLINLTIGLAVDDISSVMNQAKVKRLQMKVDLSLEIESFSYKKKNQVVKKLTYVMNKKLGLRDKFWKMFFCPKIPDFRSKRWNLNNSEDVNESDVSLNQQLVMLKTSVHSYMLNNRLRKDSDSD